MSRDCGRTARLAKCAGVAAAPAAILFVVCVVPEGANAQQIVQCHSGGTGTIPQCQQRDAQAGGSQTVQCHSGGTGTIPECKQRDAQAGTARSDQIVQCHSGGTGTIPECQQRDAHAATDSNKIVQCHSGGTGTIPECRQRDAQSGASSNQIVQCHSGGTGTIPECRQRDAQAGAVVQCHSGGTGTIPQCKQRDAQAETGSNQIVQCHSGGSGTIPECQQRDARASQPTLNLPNGGRFVTTNPLSGHSAASPQGAPATAAPMQTAPSVPMPYTFVENYSGSQVLTVGVYQNGKLLSTYAPDTASADFGYHSGESGTYQTAHGADATNLKTANQTSFPPTSDGLASITSASNGPIGASQPPPSPPQPVQSASPTSLPACPSLATGFSGLPSCTNGTYVFVPTANNTVEVFQNQQNIAAGMPVATAAARYGYNAPSTGGSSTASAPPQPSPTASVVPSAPVAPSLPTTPTYTFAQTPDGNVAIYKNGQLVSTSTPQYAAQFGYTGPGATAPVSNYNQPTPPSPSPVVAMSQPPAPMPTSPVSQPTGTSAYTFQTTPDGNVAVFQNGQRISTTTPQNASLTYGYSTPVAPTVPPSTVPATQPIPSTSPTAAMPTQGGQLGLNLPDGGKLSSTAPVETGYPPLGSNLPSTTPPMPSMAMSQTTPQTLTPDQEASLRSFDNILVQGGLIAAPLLLGNPEFDAAEIPKIAEALRIPKGWVSKLTDGPGGVEFYDPLNPQTRVRLMPGDPNSPNPAQQVPYVKDQIDGNFLRLDGTRAAGGKVPDAHIPLSDYIGKYLGIHGNTN